jgi:hypothetical protein
VLRHGIRKDGEGGRVEAELKTHQQRRLALDVEAVTALRDHWWYARPAPPDAPILAL